MTPFIIAEFGCCHDGDLEKARRLVWQAFSAGANAAKGQFWSSPKRLADRRRAPDAEAAYERYRMPAGWLGDLAEWCWRDGLEFMTTCYLLEDLPTVAPFVTRWKIASFEAQDLDFVCAHKPFGKQTIVSTGLCGGEALGQLQEFKDSHFGQWDIRLLHCISAYPTPVDQANLRAIRDFGLDGFSDHTTSVLTGALAVAAGATIIEKHLRLDETDPANPDYGHSLPPDQFALYVQNIRLAEAAMGDGLRSDAERPWSRFVVRP